jgi:aspartokinase
MIRVSDVVAGIVKQSPLLEEGLSRGIINVSALARDIQPLVEKKTLKDVTEGAIVMALKRLADKLMTHNQSGAVFQHAPDMMVRSNLFELTVSNSPTLPQKLPRLAELVAVQNNANFLTVTSGVYETTIIASEALYIQIKNILSNERTAKEIPDLSSITVRVNDVFLETPGSIAHILKHLAWEGINIIEVVSTYLELTIILRQQDTDRAFAALKNAFNQN